MTNESNLLLNAGRYLLGERTLGDLAEWVQDREEFWTALPNKSEYRRLAGTIMLVSYEVDSGVRPEDEARELIREDALAPNSSDDFEEVDLAGSPVASEFQTSRGATTKSAAVQLVG